jgi:hypothetical protein
MTTTQTIAQYAASTRNLTEVEYAGSTTSLCLALNLAMALDEAAQSRYEAIWGVAWSPLPMPGLDLADGSQPTNSTAASTTLPTVR